MVTCIIANVEDAIQDEERYQALIDPVITSANEAGISDDDIAAFYKEHWTRPIALTRREFCTWQFSAAPSAYGQNHSVVALQGNDLLAVMGAVPAPFRLAGQTCIGAELTTWVVAPEVRGRGVGKSILNYLQARYDVLAGASITKAAQPLYLGAGFAFLAYIPRFFYVADFEKAEVFTSITDPARKLQALRQEKAPLVRWTSERVAATDLAPAATANALHGFVRDRDRLAWRHDQHPAFTYEAFAVRDAARTGLGAGVIIREDKISNTVILHVVDLFGAPEHFSAALAFVAQEANCRGAAFADISATAAPLVAELRARGWSSAVDDTLIEMPSLFHPIELRRPPTASIAVWSKHAREQLYDFSRVHISRADMDLDRPTLHWYENNLFKQNRE